MSVRKKRRQDGARMPAQGAGLLRFFEEDTRGVKIKPEIAVIMAVALMVASILGPVFFA
ncbi:MAG: preprotein translocase subunit Sec61beta [Candidatus Bathyarchaeota archaeon]|nr:preprotein translocase subunit Sec61beta [Candidatus Bathyarchaeum tardum]WGM89682.1 MAG: preprotein translocase subunit Sec61beta [Candidatus Bathyarchaeum tardum]WNZ30219.1 MAG: preprotein translocase subunit Sec61beta [Candidatus Bathyarchaeota archaeon]